MIRNLSVFLTVFFFYSHLFAGTTGKITGSITDRSNGEPLAGVNIEIEGTGLGAATDIYGYYVIVNVPVGSHSVNLAYIGYKDVQIKNVHISADQTTRHDFDLEPTILEVTEAIAVVAERDMIQKDNTASMRVVSSEILQTQPMDNITRSVGLTAGVTEGSFRGGRIYTGEVKYLVDGVDISNPIGFNQYGYWTGQGDGDMAYATDLPESSINEIQVITGGMAPEYDAKSAVVSIVTKSGGNRFSGFARIIMTPSEYGQGQLIPYSFGQVSGYMSDDEAYSEAKKMGTGSAHINNGYYESPEKSFLNPKYRRYEFGFGGPVSLKDMGVGGRLTFNLGVDIFDCGGFYRRQSRYQETYSGKLIYQSPDNQYLTLTYLNSKETMRNYFHRWSRIVSTGDTLYGYKIGSKQPSKVLVGSVVFPDGRLQPVTNYDMLNNISVPEFHSNLLIFTYKNMISSNSFYEFTISRFNTAQRRRSYDPASGKTLGVEDFYELRFDQPTHPQFFPDTDFFADSDTISISNVLETYWWILPMRVGGARQDDNQVVWSFCGEFDSQLNAFNELRLGFELKSYDLMIDFQGSDRAGMYYHVKPMGLSGYISDKIETDGMIINAGFRMDYFMPNAILPDDLADALTEEAIYRQGDGSDIYAYSEPAEKRIKNPTPAENFFRLTPRLGISFPLTEHDILHINYGHYFGLPGLGELYNNYNWFQGGIIGNPNIKDEKIISYEIGLVHGFNDDIRLSLTAFYKDISDMVNVKKYIDRTTGGPYWVKTNADFGKVQGFEADLSTRRWSFIIAQIAYSYQSARGKSSVSYGDDAFVKRRPRTEDYYLDWDVRHTLSANIDFRIPENWFGNVLLDDWGMNTIITYNSGRPYTSSNMVAPPYLPPINDKRYPAWLNVDLRIYKYFPLWQTIKLGCFFEIYNLLNDRTVRNINNIQQYDLGFDDGDGVWNDPTVWAPPRQLRLGFQIGF